MDLSGVKGVAIGAAVMLALAGAAFWTVENSSILLPKIAQAGSDPAASSGNAASSSEAQPGKFGAMTAEQLFAQVSPSVVRVVARDGKFNDWFGSGFFVSSDGLLVTNYHVIQGAEFADILRADSTTLYVEGVVAEDPQMDLALLKVNVSNVRKLELGEDVPPVIGTKVFAIGNPDGLTNTLSEGLVSGLRNDRTGKLARIQTSAPISHGSSGGPLMTADGAVVGVTSSIMIDGQNLNFAVPAADVRRLIAHQVEMRKLASAGAKALDSAETREYSVVWQALGQRQYALASQLLQSMRDSQAGNPIYWLATGYLHNQLKNTDLAVEAYKNALAINPKCEPAWFWLGQAYASAHQFANAIDAYREAGKVQPRDDRAYVAAGFAYLGLHNLDKAMECFRFAGEISPQMAGPYCGMASVYNERDRYDMAEACCKQAIALKPDYAAAYLQLGIAYWHTNRQDEAYAAWNNARRFDYGGPVGKTAEYFLQRPPR
ncbi:MAG TPA: trypsin-like peptidase domain-containing protein [Tepidisphaeraceae bacterium]|nr:trypsin-like peptidase domain-containing protein [Tepidisphaeraceae bacterium]